MNSYTAFILHGRPHSWRVKCWAPYYFVRGYIAAWKLSGRCDHTIGDAHRSGLENAADRWHLAWNARPTCGLPFRRANGAIIDHRA